MAPAHPIASPSRILVVEDEPAISDVVSTALRYQGHVVSQTDNGRKGFDLASATEFDLIVLDVMLPGMDGFEVCRRLRDSGQFSPVLFLTARDQPDDRIKGFVTGGDEYLTKPFSVDELVLRVAAILRPDWERRPFGPARSRGDGEAVAITALPLNTDCEDNPDPDSTCEFLIVETPADWTSAEFDDSDWLKATEWAAANNTVLLRTTI